VRSLAPEEDAYLRTRFRKDEYSVLITDLDLPDAPSTELLAEGPKTSVKLAIVISGAHEEARRLREAHRGVQCFGKPVDGRRLISTFETLVPDGACPSS
jgi:DNA-binding NtrC family response regulator